MSLTSFHLIFTLLSVIAFPSVIEANLMTSRCSCGSRAIDNKTEIISNDVARIGEFPWMVAILRKKDNSETFVCGGSLIDRNVVLTSATCVESVAPEELTLKAGERNHSSTSENPSRQERSASKIVVHDNYNETNDIALIVADKPFNYAENVNIVCLPAEGEDTLHQNCILSGWGGPKTEETKGLLRKVELPIVPRDECENRLRKVVPSLVLSESSICAGGEPGKNACIGVRGSPLVCPIPGKDLFQQIGISSWGLSCAIEAPGVISNVAYFRTWIDTRMKELNLTPKYTPRV